MKLCTGKSVKCGRYRTCKFAQFCQEILTDISNVTCFSYSTVFYRDLDEMTKATGASPIYLDATDEFDVEGGPVGGQTRISFRNEHLSYILTWYSLSLVTGYLWYRQFVKLL